jgi:dipeptidyl aminopeptidase/acylaminoacyl peptidase
MPTTVKIDGGRIRWSEGRAAEGGRVVIVEPGPVDVTPAGTNARTRVHEYGGGAWWTHGDTVFFSEFADGRLYRLDPGQAPVAITSEPAQPHAVRFADGSVSPDGSTIVCVRERHEGGEVINDLVALPVDGSGEPTVVASGHDFYAAPRFDPSGSRLAWLTWDHPRMPWDGTELWIGDATARSTSSPTGPAGGTSTGAASR